MKVVNEFYQARYDGQGNKTEDIGFFAICRWYDKEILGVVQQREIHYSNTAQKQG